MKLYSFQIKATGECIAVREVSLDKALAFLGLLISDIDHLLITR